MPLACEEFLSKNPNACQTELYSRGESFMQLPFKYPELRPFYHDFELKYNPDDVLNLMKSDTMYMIPLGAVAIYLLVLIFGKRATDKREKPIMKTSTIPRYWNLALSLFSFWGASRTVPHLLHNINHKTFEETVCDPAYLSYGAGACGLAMQLFVLSKFPELVDTFLLILKNSSTRTMFDWKKDFLHWYHHITVLLYCWNAYTTESAAGLYFGAMNYSVHAIMYLYYFCSTLDKKSTMYLLSKKCDVFITIMQTSQMFVGVYIVASCIYYNRVGGLVYNTTDKPCNNSDFNLLCGFIMYGSYLYLFLEFLIKKYIFKTAGKSVPIKPNLETSTSTGNLSGADSSSNLKKHQ